MLLIFRDRVVLNESFRCVEYRNGISIFVFFFCLSLSTTTVFVLCVFVKVDETPWLWNRFFSSSWIFFFFQPVCDVILRSGVYVANSNMCVLVLYEYMVRLLSLFSPGTYLLPGTFFVCVGTRLWLLFVSFVCFVHAYYCVFFVCVRLFFFFGFPPRCVS